MLLDIPVGNSVFLTYGTPLLVHQFNDKQTLNDELSQLVQNRQRAAAGQASARRSVVGGWQSGVDFLNGPEPALKTLKQLMLDGTFRVMMLALGPNPGNKRIRAEPRISAWANVNRDGNYNVVHSHPGNHWSGVYFVKIPEQIGSEDLNGAFEFHDPRGATAGALPVPGFEFGQKHVITPRAGLLLVFPSWHQHMVHPYRGTDERISIAFNIFLDSYAVVDA